MLWKWAAIAKHMTVQMRTATRDGGGGRQLIAQFTGRSERYSPYTHTRTMLNTGGMRGKQRREASKGRLAEGWLLERDREWARGLLCGLVFEGLMAGKAQVQCGWDPRPRWLSYRIGDPGGCLNKKPADGKAQGDEV